LAPIAIEKNQNPKSHFGAKQHCRFGQFGPTLRFCLAGSFKLPGFSFFQFEYLSYVKSIETHARAFLTLNILSIGTVSRMEFLIFR
jgi:hypothetical protein